eukprot:CAMPEP_0179046164 /NCGR_PEP_ID=MMETSP0796-20121207/18548_1 /TAXON_ID=73915 /ORGANISM="Pyrodinium bahamense, Strain pbaha01" /LENGTH=762 /DNA_ID=CAMNT_0020742585 /DNA_START=74 /DNA_END=2359 /DNA_ORIENTATION=+
MAFGARARGILFQAALLLLAHDGLASRVDDLDLVDEEEPGPLKAALASGSETICGGEEIWRTLSVSSNAASIQNIKWSKITAVANDYISEQKSHMHRLEIELERLATRLEEKRKEEELATSTAEQARELIVSGLEPFGSLEVAQETHCGHPSIRPRAPRGAFYKSRETFREKATELFTGELLLDGDLFATTCKELLSCGDSEKCYCKQLCQQFRDIAQSLSDTTAGSRGPTTVDELVGKQKEVVNEMQYHKKEAELCKKDSETIAAFGESMKEMKADVKEKFAGVRVAEEALDDARWELEDLQDLIQEQQGKVEEALQALEQAKGEHEEVRRAFEEVLAEEETLKGKVNASENSIRLARQQLETVKASENIVMQLKSAVSSTMMKMHLYFEEAVQDPVRNIGITEDLDLSSYFVEDPMTLEAAGVLRDAVTSLHTYCENDAKEAFESVKENVDLSPLCDFDDVSSVCTDLAASITNRTAIVKEEIEAVKTWLDPYYGQPNITKETVQQFVEAGEPEGLRDIKGVYMDSEFWDYLKHWMVDGKFLKIIAALGDAIQSHDSAVLDLRKEMESLKIELGEAAQKRQEAKEKLEEAARRVENATAEKELMEKAVQDLQEQEVKMKDKISALEAEVAEAYRQWNASKEKLVQAHREAVSLLQAIQAAEDSVDDLAAQNKLDQQKVLAIEGALKEARSLRRTSEAQLWAAHRQIAAAYQKAQAMRATAQEAGPASVRTGEEASRPTHRADRTVRTTSSARRREKPGEA